MSNLKGLVPKKYTHLKYQSSSTHILKVINKEVFFLCLFVWLFFSFCFLLKVYIWQRIYLFTDKQNENICQHG